ncbi:34-kDa subunit of RNA polymerase III (C) [Rhodotorula kratochvilovae]
MPPRASTSGAGAAVASAKKLSPLELKLLNHGLAAHKGEISQQDLLAACGLSINQSVMDAINGLLRKSLLQMLKTDTGQILFRFLGKEEAKAMGSMDADEKLVLDQIKEAGDLGIWSRTLTTKTGLPSGTVTKALKALESRKQVKTVKSVKNPTRKIYMLAGIQPSVELTGGPWFTDNELDTELVETLKRVVSKLLTERVRLSSCSTARPLVLTLFLLRANPTSVTCSNAPPPPASQSIPRSITISDPSSSNPVKFRPIFPVSATPHLPTVHDVLSNISKLEVISVQLKPEHVEALLDLMVYDGLVEKVFVNRDGNGLGAPSGGGGDSKKANGKGKGKAKASSSSKSGASKRKKGAAASSDSESESDAGPRGKKGGGKRGANGKARRKRAKLASDAEESSSSSESEDFDSDEEAPSRRKKKGSAAAASDDSDEEGGGKKSSRRRKKRGKKRVKRSSSDSEDSSSDSDGGGGKAGSDASPARNKKGDVDADDDEDHAAPTGSQYVYRMIRPYAPVIGWTDMPCGKCPVEEFCSEPPRQRAVAYRRPPAATPRANGAVGGAPKLGIELEGGIQGVGMLGGAGAAIGVSEAKWGEMKGAVGKGIAPINPVDCPYFSRETGWLAF